MITPERIQELRDYLATCATAATASEPVSYVETVLAEVLNETERLHMAVYEIKDAVKIAGKDYKNRDKMLAYLNEVCDRHDAPFDIYEIQKQRHAYELERTRKEVLKHLAAASAYNFTEGLRHAAYLLSEMIDGCDKLDCHDCEIIKAVREVIREQIQKREEPEEPSE